MAAAEAQLAAVREELKVRVPPGPVIFQPPHNPRPPTPNSPTPNRQTTNHQPSIFLCPTPIHTHIHTRTVLRVMFSLCSLTHTHTHIHTQEYESIPPSEAGLASQIETLQRELDQVGVEVGARCGNGGTGRWSTPNERDLVPEVHARYIARVCA